MCVFNNITVSEPHYFSYLSYAEVQSTPTQFTMQIPFANKIKMISIFRHTTPPEYASATALINV